MKKLLLVALAVLLAVPAVGHAAVSSRMWDLVIQGYVAGIVEVSDQESGVPWPPTFTPARRTGTQEVRQNEFGNLSANVDARIGFLVKGPDTWGAKTSAYMEWDFSGAQSNTNGGAKIRHVWVNWDWANDSIKFGNTTSVFRDVGIGLPPGVTSLLPEPVLWGGPRDFQLRWTHRIGKAWETKLAATWGGRDGFYGTGWVENSTGTNVSATGTANNYTHTKLPFLQGQVRWNSDSCGKVGNMNLAVAMSGVVGQYAIERDSGVAGRNRYSQTHGYGWLGNISFQVPIIPERNNNKAGAIALEGHLEAVQGLPIGVNPGSFRRTGTATTASADDYSYPRGYLLQATGYFFLTNTVHVNLTYALNKYEGSRRAMATAGFPGGVDRKQYYMISLMYQPNPALVTGIEYTRYVADYNHSAAAWPAGKSQGIANAIRFGAYYYF